MGAPLATGSRDGIVTRAPRPHRTWTTADPAWDRIHEYTEGYWCPERIALTAVDEIAAPLTQQQRYDQALTWAWQAKSKAEHAAGYGTVVNTSKAAADAASTASHSSSCYRTLAMRMVAHCGGTPTERQALVDSIAAHADPPQPPAPKVSRRRRSASERFDFYGSIIFFSMLTVAIFGIVQASLDWNIPYFSEWWDSTFGPGSD